MLHKFQMCQKGQVPVKNVKVGGPHTVYSCQRGQTPGTLASSPVGDHILFLTKIATNRTISSLIRQQTFPWEDHLLIPLIDANLSLTDIITKVSGRIVR